MKLLYTLNELAELLDLDSEEMADTLVGLGVLAVRHGKPFDLSYKPRVMVVTDKGDIGDEVSIVVESLPDTWKQLLNTKNADSDEADAISPISQRKVTKDTPNPIPTSLIAQAFGAVHRDEKYWKEQLSHPTWSLKARRDPGRLGLRGDATWDPVHLINSLLDKERSLKNQIHRFDKIFTQSEFQPWAAEWGKNREYD